MKILHVSTEDISGGAARAAYRLHKGLVAAGEESRMIVVRKKSDDPHVFQVTLADEDTQDFSNDFNVIQNYYIQSHRTPISNTMFSFSYPGYNLSDLNMVREADVINLHWIANFQSPVTLKHLLSLGKPVIWTLHDQWPMTGGCHYAAGCDQYKHDCSSCPQLDEDPFKLPAAVLKDRMDVLINHRLTVVTPSRWLASCAENSRVFQNQSVDVIPYGLETDLFGPVPDNTYRQETGIEQDHIVIMFCAESLGEKRKGFKELIRAIQYCLEDTEFKNLVAKDRIRLLCLGNAENEQAFSKIPTIFPGFTDSDAAIRRIYSAADIFVLPSLEDNLPNTILEAMSCQTPVVAFNTGGMPDMVIDGVTGKLAQPGDAQDLARAILYLVAHPDDRHVMGEACRKKVCDRYRLDIQAKNYIALYEKLLDSVGHDHLESFFALPKAGIRVLPDWETGVHTRTVFKDVLCRSLQEKAAFLKNRIDEDEVEMLRLHDIIAKRNAQNLELADQLKESESDRTSRLAQIRELTEQLKESEADRGSRFDQIEKLTNELKESEADRASRFDQIQQLTKFLEESEADRAARLSVIEDQQQQIDEYQKTIASLQETIHSLQETIGSLQAALADLENSVFVKIPRKAGWIKKRNQK